MKCDVCGCENKDNALFCAECGKALKGKPIALDLQQIKVPASSRKAHIVKVSAKKNEATQQTVKEEPAAEENVVLFNPDKAAIEQAEKEARTAQEQAPEQVPAQVPEQATVQEDAPAEESEFIPLQITPEQPTNHTEAPAAPAEKDATLVPMKIRNWIPVFILSAIPVVNLIMLFVWSFSSRTNKSKQSFARLSLIVALICVVVAVIAAILMKTVFQVNFTSLLQGIKA